MCMCGVQCSRCWEEAGAGCVCMLGSCNVGRGINTSILFADALVDRSVLLCKWWEDSCLRMIHCVNGTDFVP
jgi:hypothetical protein